MNDPNDPFANFGTIPTSATKEDAPQQETLPPVVRPSPPSPTTEVATPAEADAVPLDDDAQGIANADAIAHDMLTARRTELLAKHTTAAELDDMDLAELVQIYHRLRDKNTGPKKASKKEKSDAALANF